MTFCETCGAQTMLEWTGRYDRETGQKRMRAVCSVDPCAHDGHDLALVRPFRDIGFWQWFFNPAAGAAIYKCKRCGSPESPRGFD